MPPHNQPETILKIESEAKQTDMAEIVSRYEAILNKLDIILNKVKENKKKQTTH